MSKLKSGAKKASEKEKQQRVCDLCTGPFKASEEVLQCEGNCRLHMHRYCAGLPKTQYEELAANSTPFICLVCTQRLHNAQVLVLQNELASLKSELLELRAIIANSSVTQSASPAVHDEIPRKLGFLSACAYFENSKKCVLKSQVRLKTSEN